MFKALCCSFCSAALHRTIAHIFWIAQFRRTSKNEAPTTTTTTSAIFTNAKNSDFDFFVVCYFLFVLRITSAAIIARSCNRLALAMWEYFRRIPTFFAPKERDFFRVCVIFSSSPCHIHIKRSHIKLSYPFGQETHGGWSMRCNEMQCNGNENVEQNKRFENNVYGDYVNV